MEATSTRFSGKNGLTTPNSLPFTNLTITNINPNSSKSTLSPSPFLNNNKFANLLTNESENGNPTPNQTEKSLNISTRVQNYSAQLKNTPQPKPITIHTNGHVFPPYMQDMPQYPNTTSSAPQENHLQNLSNNPPPTLDIGISSQSTKPTVAPMQLGNDDFPISKDNSNTPSPNQSFKPRSSTITIVPSIVLQSNPDSTTSINPLPTPLNLEDAPLQPTQSLT